MFYRPFYYVIGLLFLVSCTHGEKAPPVVQRLAVFNKPADELVELSDFSKKLSDAGLERLKHKVTYDGAYIKIPYPGGDVPESIGVCTDEIIRIYRSLGIDLQKEVHEDMQAHFNDFPNAQKWGLHSTDTNIDHRRVLNLQVFFAHKGTSLQITNNPKHYVPGDIVTWDVEGNPHIGIVVNRKQAGQDRYMIVHNIGAGPMLEDMLFKYPIVGHYRYYGNNKSYASR